LEGTQETYTLAHEENVRFVSEAWQQVQQQLDGGPAGEGGPRPVQYVERTPNPRLQMVGTTVPGENHQLFLVAAGRGRCYTADLWPGEKHGAPPTHCAWLGAGHT
uniref:MAPK regulated corepressor interacting protein 2 n=1 Tax=Colobus angolensis palliatus TaxID=336983 RepID=A0A2K5IIG8_COLAP